MDNEGGEKNAIAVIKLQGIIVNNNEESENSINSYTTISMLDKVGKSNKYKGVLLVVDSPGGMAAPSLEISYKIREIKKQKPVVVYIENLGASGAFYFSSAADYIVSNPQAIVGSIGVIITIPQLYKALDKIGIEFINIKTGKYKDSLSPYKPISQEQKDYFQSLIMEYYYQFVKDVAQNRNLKTEKQIKELYSIADGRVFTSYTAVKYGLVDKVGVLDDAKQKIKELVKDDKVKFVEVKPPKKTFLEKLAESKEDSIIRITNELFYKKYGVWMIIQ
jgi:protease-4